MFDNKQVTTAFCAVCDRFALTWQFQIGPLPNPRYSVFKEQKPAEGGWAFASFDTSSMERMKS